MYASVDTFIIFLNSILYYIISIRSIYCSLRTLAQTVSETKGLSH